MGQIELLAGVSGEDGILNGQDRSRAIGVCWIFLWLTLMVGLMSANAIAAPGSGSESIALAEDGLEPDPEEAEGNFDERARSIQRWLQKRELERIDMGLSHQYEKPRSLNDEDEDEDEETENVPTIRGFRRTGRDLYVRLRRPAVADDLGSRGRHVAHGRGGRLWLKSVSLRGRRDGGASSSRLSHSSRGGHGTGRARTNGHASSSRSAKRSAKHH